MYVKTSKEPIHETNCDEWLGTYGNLITCLVAIFYTPKHFRPNINDPNSKYGDTWNDTLVYDFKSCLHYPNLCKVKGNVLRRIKFCIKFGFQGMTFKMFHKALDNLNFDLEFQQWNGKEKFMRYNGRQRGESTLGWTKMGNSKSIFKIQI